MFVWKEKLVADVVIDFEIHVRFEAEVHAEIVVVMETEIDIVCSGIAVEIVGTAAADGPHANNLLIHPGQINHLLG